MPKTLKRKAVSIAKEDDESKESQKPKKLKVELKETKKEPPEDSEDEILEEEPLEQSEEKTIEEEEPVKKPRRKRVNTPAPIDGDPKSNLLWKRNPGMFRQLRQSDNQGVDLKKITYGSTKILNWWCDEHVKCTEHVWRATVASRTNSNSGCPFCSTMGSNKKDCKCTRPSFQNADGSQKPGYPSKMKRCANVKCRKEKQVSEFSPCKNSKDKFKSVCKECCNAKSHITRTVNAAITRLFFHGKKCKDCGEPNDILFESDHVHNNKAKLKNGNNVKHMASSLSASNLCLELKKTEVVCIMCHRLRTYSRKPLTKAKSKRKYEDYRLKRELVQKLKLERQCCAHCPTKISNNNHGLIDWDHIDPKTKISSISNMIRGSKYSTDDIKAEIEKCQALCCKCHRLKTAKDGEWRTLSDFPAHVIAKARQFLNAVFERDANGNYIHLKPGEFNGWSFRLIQHK